MTTHRQQIDSTLVELAEQLHPLVTAKIDLTDLNKLSRQKKLPNQKDICFLLNAMYQYWDDFKYTIDEKERTQAKVLISELREIRNGHAHHQDFSLRDTYRALDTMQRLANLLNLEIKTKLDEQVTALLKEISQPTTRPKEDETPEIKALKQKYAELLEKLPFNEVKQLDLALTHSSYLWQNPYEVHDDNERLEFLGDTVISLVIAHYFYQNNPRYREAELTQVKSSIENNANLARFAQQLKLGNFVKVGKGESQDSYKILSDAFEAVIGAYFLDSGLNAVQAFLTPFIESMLHTPPDSVAQDVSVNQSLNYKNKLQHWAQTKRQNVPEYKSIKAGLQHSPRFTATVIINGKQYGQAEGKNKKEAEQNAAFKACKQLGLVAKS
ncbi:ribonuclease III [Spirulina subsalsa FACHB-351]|uniref:Ribonuclease 3 n=1 Tax=Spirulina subsalsa FACHB-351 TaxID=234711 RepID=A0ABT3L730_9CYAN|nr:ribonuclease III [Spirulina subsalsa]MCW6037321.1 ribonuclease III [Spirulina subsalsa FACHB-351]